MKITLELYGLPNQTTEAEFLRREGNVAIVRAYDDVIERYSLDTGKNLDTHWDFWQICARDCEKIRCMEGRPPDVAAALDRLGL